MHLQDLPPDARPREKLLARGAAALADAELLALLLRTGIRGKGVLQMAHELLHLKPNAEGTPGFDGVAGLLNATGDDLRRIKGLGPAKRAELLAVNAEIFTAQGKVLVGFKPEEWRAVLLG